MTLLQKLSAREAVIGIVGLGYVGIPLALRFSGAGFRVLGFDIDADRVRALNAGKSPIAHIAASEVGAMVKGGFQATIDYGRIPEADAIIICVPTPLSKHREPDLSFIVGTMEKIAPHLRAGQAVSLDPAANAGGMTVSIALAVVVGR